MIDLCIRNNTFTFQNVNPWNEDEASEFMWWRGCIVGRISDPKERIKAIHLYFGYAFCRTAGIKRLSPHHIRKLEYNEGRLEREELNYFKVNEFASPSLCGTIPAGHAVDIIAMVNLDFNHTCEECAWKYWQALLDRKTHG